MDAGGGNPNLRAKGFQIDTSWIPTTPAKPSLTAQSICEDGQRNQPAQSTWLDFERVSQGIQVSDGNFGDFGILPGNFLQVKPNHSVDSWSELTDHGNVSADFGSWEASMSVERDINDMYTRFSMDDMDKLSTVPFSSLLALAQAAGTPTAAQGPTLQTSFDAVSSSFTPICDSRGDVSWDLPGTTSQFENSHDLQIPQCGNFVASTPRFDLNSPPRVTDAILTGNIPTQYVAIRPDTAENASKGLVSGAPMSNMDNVVKATYLQEIATVERAEVNEFQNKESQLTQLLESDKLECGDNHDPDQSKTPQQKSRRRKHRPKVVIEGQAKKTPRPKTPKPTGSETTPTGKRKYVRRKGTSDAAPTTPEEGSKESDPKKTPPGSMETPTGKRKYVRRKDTKISASTPLEEDTNDENYSETSFLNRKSCKRSLNFDSGSQIRDENSHVPSSKIDELQAEYLKSEDQSRSVVQPVLRKDESREKTETGFSCRQTSTENQESESSLSMPVIHFCDPLVTDRAASLHEESLIRNQMNCATGKSQKAFSEVALDKETLAQQMRVNTSKCYALKSLIGSNCNNTASLPQGAWATGFEQQMCTTDDRKLSCSNMNQTHYDPMQAYQAFLYLNQHTNHRVSNILPPQCNKKRRTEGHNSARSSAQSAESVWETHVRHKTYTLSDWSSKTVTTGTGYKISATQHDATYAPTTNLAVTREQQISEGISRTRDLSSVYARCNLLQSYPATGAMASEVIQQYQTSTHAFNRSLVAETHGTMTDVQSKRNLLVGSATSSRHNPHQFLTKSIGPSRGRPRKEMPSVDTIAEQLSRLVIDAGSSQQRQQALITYHMKWQEQNALVLYQRDGTVVPFEGPFQIRKRPPRPKVDLDEETNRVWNLLLEDINNDGIDGRDEKSAKWWEEERRVFQGRAESFIARMHRIQGDRRFSPWKGSVVDSVVGVFLTQNVSDHLSSSAFMYLAARFPLGSRNNVQLPEEGTSITAKEPQAYVLHPDEAIESCGEKSSGQTNEQSSRELEYLGYNKGKEEFNSSNSTNISDVNRPSNRNELDSPHPYACHEPAANRSTTRTTESAAALVEDQREMDDALSSQNSAVSSQNSVDSLLAQKAEKNDLSMQSTSEAEAKSGDNWHNDCDSTSFLKLLQMAGSMSRGVYEQGSENMLSSNEVGVNSGYQGKESSNDSEVLSNPISGCSDSTLHLVINSEEQEESRNSALGKKCTSVGDFKEKERCTTEKTGSLVECIPQFTSQSSMVNQKGNSRNKHQTGLNREINVEKHIEIQENSSSLNQVRVTPNFSGSVVDVSERYSTTETSRKSEQKEVRTILNEQSTHLDGGSGTVDEINVNQSKVPNRRPGKEQQDAVDWEILRKQAEINGKREKTANTADSVDWEAVRCADVSEIAYTIRERGMNNRLAERIKDFLNRLVRDHGSIDLEWLRDVPPDKAKEYLLSFRGLGLKSVECVRLLTLHHLAFPVDTNVGRIAVRLGWVPLQPLPESMQLHLLELYPVLESIQKYLWPRLCKLDQKTLYELHYQMITFGKVFCTKSKPNCNACPMRGECRHFASAFASARLSLPPPEEKSIVSTTNNKAGDQHSVGPVNLLELSLPQAHKPLEAQIEVSNREPIIEVPATPEPLVEVPDTPDLDQTEIVENDIEDTYSEDPDEIPVIELNMVELTQNVKEFMENSIQLHQGEMSKALVALTPQVASIPTPKLKNISRLRTEHRVYELPDSHPLLERFDKREPDDPCPYLLAIWTPGETASSIEPSGSQCGSQESGKLCDEETCFSCNSIREANSQTVRGTILVPCRTAMRGSFPLNGTYFQVNEVFSDHESSLQPVDVPRDWLWKLPRRTVYFGTSIPTIFKGLSTESIQHCFWRGFVCVRGFDQRTRAPRPLVARLHFPASKLAKTKGRSSGQ